MIGLWRAVVMFKLIHQRSRLSHTSAETSIATVLCHERRRRRRHRAEPQRALTSATNSFLSNLGGALDAVDEVDGCGSHPRGRRAVGWWRWRRWWSGQRRAGADRVQWGRRVDRGLGRQAAWTCYLRRRRRVVVDFDHALLDLSQPPQPSLLPVSHHITDTATWRCSTFEII